MKKITQAAFLFSVFPFFSHAFTNVNDVNAGKSHSDVTGHNLFSPHATFSKQWVDYDILQDGVKGMRIHIKFSAYEMKGLDSYLAIYFQDDYGNNLKDKNSKFNSTSGDVAVYRSVNPCCDATDYDDLDLFMPYDELDLDGGKYNLTMNVELIYKQGGLIQHLNYYDFEFTQPGSTTTNNTTTRTSSSLNATFDKMWVDYDVTENGIKGMRIHVKFGMTNMKDVDSYLAVYFSTKDGTKLTSTNTSYSSKEGQLAAYKSLKPGYNDASYNDAQIFMPYSEFNLTTGKYNLTMDLDLIYKNGDLIKHLQYYDFTFQTQ
ncbi:MAG TPA: hypothetical protein VGI82_00065 [Chitinophagaceae bacterium]